jgi:hypothetical protein
MEAVKHPHIVNYGIECGTKYPSMRHRPHTSCSQGSCSISGSGVHRIIGLSTRVIHENRKATIVYHFLINNPQTVVKHTRWFQELKMVFSVSVWSAPLCGHCSPSLTSAWPLFSLPQPVGNNRFPSVTFTFHGTVQAEDEETIIHIMSCGC